MLHVLTSSLLLAMSTTSSTTSTFVVVSAVVGIVHFQLATIELEFVQIPYSGGSLI